MEGNMEGYLTSTETAKIWGISERRIRTLCTQERIEGATKIGHIWIIPKGTEKPNDQRVKSGKYIKRQNIKSEI